LPPTPAFSLFSDFTFSPTALKRIWYAYLKVSVFLTALVYFRRVERQGRGHVPKKGPVLLGVRHSNALMDPLMSGIYTSRRLHFLVRADVFKNPWIRKLWASMNMMPIFRIRDGRETMGRNAVIFERCHHILRSGKALEIFPEGGHSARHRLEPLKKGAARIALGALDGMTRDHDIPIVPVGLNYSSEKAFRGHLSVVYGPPVSSHAHYDPADPLSPASVNSLTRDLEEGLRARVLDIRPPAPYAEMNALRVALEMHHRGIAIPKFEFSKDLSERIVQACADEKVKEELVALQKEHAALRKNIGLREAGLPSAFVRSSRGWGRTLIRLPLLPLILPGLLLHAPMLIPASRAPRLLKDPMFFAALRFISGMFLTQLLYLVYFVLGWIILANGWYALAAPGGVLALGAAALPGYDAWVDVRRMGRMRRVERQFSEKAARMRELQVRMSDLLGLGG
jgi:1-acyl-sn-glycerol-3-phosphate acyltransferase